MAVHERSSGELVVTRGQCVALFAYDLGLSVSLEKVEKQLALRPGETEQREMLRRTRRAPTYFDFRPAPIRLTRTIEPIEITGVLGAGGGGVVSTLPTLELVIYDFGAVSLGYSVPISGALEQLMPLADALYENRSLLEDSRRHVERLLRELGDAVQTPDLSGLVEDYLVFQIVEHESVAGGIGAWADANRARLARMLRAEKQALSGQEIEDAMGCRVSYSPVDLAVIDWNAAVLVDPDPSDATAALEFANVELLEMRHLDDRLDGALDEIHRLSQSGRRGGEPALARVAELQTESAMLFEAVNNALKLLGDQYLARLYRLTAQRFHLPEWDASILRKLATLESIYQKLSDRSAHRRGEVLELIIILLIAFEITMSLMDRFR